MLLFLKTQTVFGLFVLYTLYPFFIEMRGNFQSPQPEAVVKNVGDKEYIVKTEFSTFSTTQKPSEDQLDYDNEFEIDEMINPLCSDIEFECSSDYTCIPIESYCDGKNDCTDESDELTCARTSKIFTDMMSTSNNISLILLMIVIMITCKIYGGVRFLYMKVTHR